MSCSSQAPAHLISRRSWSAYAPARMPRAAALSNSRAITSAPTISPPRAAPHRQPAMEVDQTQRPAPAAKNGEKKRGAFSRFRRPRSCSLSAQRAARDHGFPLGQHADAWPKAPPPAEVSVLTSAAEGAHRKQYRRQCQLRRRHRRLRRQRMRRPARNRQRRLRPLMTEGPRKSLRCQPIRPSPRRTII